MLIKREHLEGMATGRITAAFRNWNRPTVKTGGTLRTAVGVLAIDAVDVIDKAEITEKDARAAGYESRAALLKHLETCREGTLHRVRLHFAGLDPRAALRDSDSLTDSEMDELRTRLAKIDAGPKGAWTTAALRHIANFPQTPAGDVAAAIGVEKEWLKVNLRKLKELGLTESLTPGYRLSPRGEAVLGRLGS